MKVAAVCVWSSMYVGWPTPQIPKKRVRKEGWVWSYMCTGTRVLRYLVSFRAAAKAWTTTIALIIFVLEAASGGTSLLASKR